MRSVWTATDGRPAPIRRSGGLESCVASEEGVAEEARTRGFAAPAFAGCAFVEDVLLMYGAVQEVSSSLSHTAGPASCLAVEKLPTALSLGVRPVLNLEPSGLRIVWVGLPLRHDALEVGAAGRR
jgi:hypothetical protein